MSAGVIDAFDAVDCGFTGATVGSVDALGVVDAVDWRFLNDMKN